MKYVMLICDPADAPDLTEQEEKRVYDFMRKNVRSATDPALTEGGATDG